MIQVLLISQFIPFFKKLKTYVEALFLKKITIFLKRKSLATPLFTGIYETICHDSFYTSIRCHMDFSFGAFDSNFGLLRAFESPFLLFSASDSTRKT